MPKFTTHTSNANIEKIISMKKCPCKNNFKIKGKTSIAFCTLNEFFLPIKQ